VERTKKANSIYLKYRAVPVAILKDLGRVLNGKWKDVEKRWPENRRAEKRPLKNKVLDSQRPT
jgi:hypothetical protein